MQYCQEGHFFNNNDIDSINLPDQIHPIEIITNFSKVPAYKILGIYLDENFTFEYHFKVLHSKISKSLYSLNCVKHILPVKSLKTLYYALIHPHFLYCLPIISCSSKKNINLLTKSQKWAIQIINKSKYNAHTQPLFASSVLPYLVLPISDLITQQNLHLIHAFVYNFLPFSFSNYLQVVTQSEKQPCVLRSAKNKSVYKLKCSLNLLTIINVYNAAQSCENR